MSACKLWGTSSFISYKDRTNIQAFYLYCLDNRTENRCYIGSISNKSFIKLLFYLIRFYHCHKLFGGFLSNELNTAPFLNGKAISLAFKQEG